MDKILIQTRDFLCGQQNPSDWLPFNLATDQICVRLDTWEHNVKEMIEDQTQTFARQYEKILASLEYQNSFARVVDQMRLPQPVDSLFNYRNPKIGFYGREKETAYLDGFLDREEPVLFTAVNGPAGAGKSKFLYEYVKALSANPNWKCLFLQNRKILEKFTGLCEWNYPVNLLVVIDYAGDYAGLIGEWLVSLRTGECPLKMRIVLLEREGVGKNRGVDGIQEKIVINPMWYEQLLAVHSNEDIRSILYTADKDSAFLELPVLSDKALKQIIKDFAKAEQKVLSEEDQKQILKYCKKIEKNDQGACRPRPLILLFIVDAWDPQDKHHRWDIQELLLKIIHRYKKHWETVLCQGNKNVYMAVERLLIYATATGGWKIKDPLPEYLQKDLTVVKEFCMTRDKLDQLFRSVNEKFEWDGMLSPLEPDLIGELFVLEYLQNAFEAEKMVEVFHTSKKYLLFLFRSIQDYADVDKYADLFSDGLKTLLKESLIRKIPELYAELLVNLSAVQKEEYARITLEHLEKLALDNQYTENEEIVLAYAKGLVNLTAKQEAREAENIVEKLESLAGDRRYAGNEEIVLRYAEGLVNLGFLYYSQHDYEQAEKRFAQAHQLHCPNGSINLCYMIRRHETKTHSLDEFKEIMLSVWEDKDAFAVMNMALYLAEYEDDWKGADDLISSLAETEDFSGVIDWWSHLEELEGLMVMTWLERNKICDPCYILEGENILKSLCERYPGIPDWMIEPAVELAKGEN